MVDCNSEAFFDRVDPTYLKIDVAAPGDPCKTVYLIFCWLGVGTLLPWNFFISLSVGNQIVEIFSKNLCD